MVVRYRKNKDSFVYNIRQRSGLSQKAFAKKYKINIATLQSWEQGIRKPSEFVLYALDRLVAIDFGFTALLSDNTGDKT